ncbi:MAG: DUF6048 family protein, partial [Cyclobacteriaceae bacterium]|nr:DUF6048 family protein [Cyclobacteriaceae bacterium]
QRGQSFDYRSQGQFWRVGLDKNYMAGSREGNVVSLGLRYAEAQFSDQIRYLADSLYLNGAYQPAFPIELNNAQLKARWLEMTAGMQVKLWHHLSVGYQFRYRFAKKVTGDDWLEPYDIPGFGRHKKSSTLVKKNTVGFTYYLYWTIPFREKPLPKQKKQWGI